MSDVAVRIKNVRHAYARPDGGVVDTLDDVSIDVRKGELLGLIGPSGCGKSTFLNIIGGLVQPTSGEVKIKRSADPRTLAETDRLCVPGKHAVPVEHDPRQREGCARVPGRARPTAASRAMEAIEAVGLADFANNYPHQLSGGMKQRASLARALSLQDRIFC